MIGVAVVNIPLAWGFGWDRPGATCPTLGFVGIARGTALAGIRLAARGDFWRGWQGTLRLRLRPELFRPSFDLLGVRAHSVPAAFDSLSVVVGQFWFLGIVNNLGPRASAAHGIALVWGALGYLSGLRSPRRAMTLVWPEPAPAGPTRRRRAAGWRSAWAAA